MSGNRKILLDSNILIYASKGEFSFDELFDQYDEFYISVITFIEVMGFDFKNEIEEKLIREYLNFFDIIYLDSEIAEITIKIRKEKKIKLPDALILATAVSKGCSILTKNEQDFYSYESVNIIAP